MANEPIIDLSTVDLTHVVADRAELDTYLEQRGTFSMVDYLAHVDGEAGILVGVKAIKEDDWWAPDHVPGRPMFPGALMIETAAQISSYDYSKHRLRGDVTRFVGFGGVDDCRFRGIVAPPCNLIITVKLVRAGSRMFRYQTQGFVQQDGVLSEKRAFEATVLGVLIG